ncbi:MAG: hypothetical protein ACREAU_00955 [Nitrosopumilaceae archaeon]
MKLNELLRIPGVIRQALSYSDGFWLKEGLIISFPLEKVIRIFKKYFPQISFHSDQAHNTFTIMIQYKLKSEEFVALLRLLKNVGWYIASFNLNQGDEEKFTTEDSLQKIVSVADVLQLNIEARYDVPETRIPIYLYHLTPLEVWQGNKIQTRGLIPRSGSKISYHPDRIYFAVDFGAVDDMLSHMRDITNKNQWALLRINISKITDKKFKIYHDPNFKEWGHIRGYYTLSNIPPAAIDLLKIIR